MLELGDLLREGRCLSGKGPMLGAQSSLAKRRGKCLVYFMVRQPLCIVAEFRLFRGNSHRRERLRCLPGTHIDKGLLRGWRARRAALLAQEGKIFHRASRGPEKDETQHQERAQRNKKDCPGLSDSVRTAGLNGARCNGGDCHTCILTKSACLENRNTGVQIALSDEICRSEKRGRQC